MNYNITKIKNNIILHEIKNKKYKTNLCGVFLTFPINRENITKNSLIVSVLRRGCKEMPTLAEINKEFEEMYGGSFECGVDEIGDNYVLKFYIETVNDNYLPEKNLNILKKSLDKLFSIIFDPIIKNNGFDEQYVEQEKENIRRIIKNKSDNKSQYAFDRCIEEMYKNEPYGLYKYGYEEDLDLINNVNLYEYYKNIVNNSRIDIYISGNVENTDKIIKENEHICLLKDREDNVIIQGFNPRIKEMRTIEEKMDIAQAKLVIGINVNLENSEQKYVAQIYNAILGGTANSKLFQEVREKNGLAYTAVSMYKRAKNNLFIRCGIETKNYEKALKIINKQLEDMKLGNFSDEDIINSKKFLSSGIKSIRDEQDGEILYLFSKELLNDYIDDEKYIEKIQNVTKEDIVKVANLINIDTIYFLKSDDFKKEEN